MASTLSKVALLLIGVCFLSAAPVLADSTQFTFTGTLGDIGPGPVTFTAGSLSLTATGWSAPSTPADMFAKNTGPDEMGLGLAAEPQHEISGTMFIQLNIANILAANPSAGSVSLESITGSDTYAVWGSHTAGVLGTNLGTGLTGPSFTLPDLGMFQFISISAPTGNVLLHDLDVTTPEPSSASMLLLGLFALLSAGTLAKKLIA